METARFVPLEGFRPYPEEEMIRRAERFADDMERRRTVRQFSTRTVPRQVIELCLDAAENEERAFYSGRAPRDWLDALAPLGTDDHKPYLEAAPYLVVVFGQPYHLDVDGRRVKHYYVPESVGIATGVLITAIHHAGLVSLVHTPSPMSFLNKLLGRPDTDRPFLILVVGYPAEDAVVPVIRKKALGAITSYR